MNLFFLDKQSFFRNKKIEVDKNAFNSAQKSKQAMLMDFLTVRYVRNSFQITHSQN